MCLYGISKRERENRLSKGWLLLLTIFLYFSVFTAYDKIIPYTIYYVFECMIILTVILSSCLARKLIMENPVVVSIGNISMEIFLTHLSIVTYVKILWEKMLPFKCPTVVEWIVIWTAIIIVGYFTHKIIASIPKKRRNNPVWK